MENKKLEISTNDIRKYLKDLKKNHSDEYEKYYRYKEAMFVKYMKEHNEDTKESLEIRMKKYNSDKISIVGTSDYDNYSTLKKQTLISFDNYLYGVNNLDISGICHILIPTIKYYGEKECYINQLYAELGSVSSRLTIPMEYPMKIIESTLDDYRVCGKVKTIGNRIHIKMGRDTCRGELLAYQDFYDENKVKRIKKIMREDLK